MINSRTGLGTECHTEGKASSAAHRVLTEEVALGQGSEGDREFTTDMDPCVEGKAILSRAALPGTDTASCHTMFVWEATSRVEGQAAQEEREVVQNKAEEVSRTSSRKP